MKLVVDTNVLISGLLWGGPPNRILKWARDGVIVLFACESTINELKRVIQYRRFGQRLTHLKKTPSEAIAYTMNLVTFVPNPLNLPPVITDDPFDDIFLALAFENEAHLIISGDHHILDLKEYRSIQILTPSLAVQVIESFLIQPV
jgi:putative PIN family toxin of toxin-antitoxin system